MNNWGSILAFTFLPGKNIPVISFHGDSDSTVAADSSYGGCSGPQLSYGSILIHEKMQTWGTCNQTNIKPGGGHGVYTGTSAQTSFRVGKAACFFKSIMCNSCMSYYTTDSIPATCSGSLSIEDSQQHAQYILYPNPAHTVLYIESSVDGNTQFRISDMTGNIYPAEVHWNVISVENLPDGIYVLQIRQKNEIVYLKFVKN
jgi:hypothetical protein